MTETTQRTVAARGAHLADGEDERILRSRRLSDGWTGSGDVGPASTFSTVAVNGPCHLEAIRQVD